MRLSLCKTNWYANCLRLLHYLVDFDCLQAIAQRELSAITSNANADRDEAQVRNDLVQRARIHAGWQARIAQLCSEVQALGRKQVRCVPHVRLLIALLRQNSRNSTQITKAA